MFQLASTVMSLLALVLAFVANKWAWIPCAVTTAGLYLVLLGVRGKRYGPVPELSAGANEVLRKFGHFYAMPFAGSEVSAAASTIALAAGAVGVVSIFKGNWWGLGIGVLVYLIAAPLARQFNPTKFLVDDERAAHDEIVEYLRHRRVSSAPDLRILNRLFSHKTETRPALDVMRTLSDEVVGLGTRGAIDYVAALRARGHSVAPNDTQEVLDEFVFVLMHFVDRAANAMLTRRTQDVFLPSFVLSTLVLRIRTQGPTDAAEAAEAAARALLSDFDSANSEYAGCSLTRLASAADLETFLPFRFGTRAAHAAKVPATGDALNLCMTGLFEMSSTLNATHHLAQMVQIPDA